MALPDRQPPQGLIHHSDRGSQYASQEYQQLLAQHGVTGSMSRSGNCWDNAVAESFFATLKLELAYRNQWSTRAQARSEIFEYIEAFYNRRRRHSTLGYLCPNEFERLAIRHALKPSAPLARDLACPMHWPLRDCAPHTRVPEKIFQKIYNHDSEPFLTRVSTNSGQPIMLRWPERDGRVWHKSLNGHEGESRTQPRRT